MRGSKEDREENRPSVRPNADREGEVRKEGGGELSEQIRRGKSGDCKGTAIESVMSGKPGEESISRQEGSVPPNAARRARKKKIKK